MSDEEEPPDVEERAGGGSLPIRVDTPCPDCNNPYMIVEGERRDIINDRMATVVRCPQCRRWLFADP